MSLVDHHQAVVARRPPPGRELCAPELAVGGLAHLHTNWRPFDAACSTLRDCGPRQMVKMMCKRRSAEARSNVFLRLHNQRATKRQRARLHAAKRTVAGLPERVRLVSTVRMQLRATNVLLAWPAP